jgi:hypothetical protein
MRKKVWLPQIIRPYLLTGTLERINFESWDGLAQ